MKNAKIINDCYSFVKWLLHLIVKFPRNYRYTLGARIESCLYDLIELLQRGYMAKEKVGSLMEASFKLDHLRMILRLSYDMHLFSDKVHLAMIGQMDNIGRQLGGWLKSLEKQQ